MVANIQQLSSFKKRLLVALFVVLGLSICAGAIFSGMSTKTQSLANQPSTPLASGKSTAPQETAGQSSITSISIAAADPLTNEKQKPDQNSPRKNTQRSKLRSSSRNKIASIFPAPPVQSEHTTTNDPLHGGLVEVWNGDKKSIVAVPPGSKFED